jgi:hypothetical protein
MSSFEEDVRPVNKDVSEKTTLLGESDGKEASLDRGITPVACKNIGESASPNINTNTNKEGTCNNPFCTDSIMFVHFFGIASGEGNLPIYVQYKCTVPGQGWKIVQAFRSLITPGEPLIRDTINKRWWLFYACLWNIDISPQGAVKKFCSALNRVEFESAFGFDPRGDHAGELTNWTESFNNHNMFGIKPCGSFITLGLINGVLFRMAATEAGK